MLKKRISSILLVFALVLGTIGVMAPHTAVKATVDPDSTVVIACSDFQNPNGNAAGQALVQSIINKIKEAGYTTAQGFLCSGDYNYNYSTTSSTAQECVTALRTTVEDNYGTGVDFAMVQGNHDQVAIGTAGMAPSGNNDTDNYGVFVINEDDYMWYNNNEATIQATAANLKKYLDGKRKAKYTKPIFVMSHLALHYSMRTYNDGDDRYAKYIFNELNEAGEAGLNIIFMYGHNHSNGWDDYIGGAAVYLEKGDDILISTGSKTEYTTETLNFTYMNAGYVGYYENHNGGDDALTMSVFEIRDDEVIVSRFDQNGLHNLKAVGVSNAYKNEVANGGYSPDTRAIASPAELELNKIVTKPVETPAPTDNPGQTSTDRRYTKVTDLSQIEDGDRILMIYSNKFMLPEKKELNDRIGFNLESTGGLSLNDQITGAYGAKEWTYTKSNSKWLIGSNSKYIKLTTVSGKGITATLENSGDSFTIGGSANAYTFTADTGVLNYNSSRDLINGYAGSPAGFTLYRYDPARKYRQVSDVSKIKDGDRILMIYNGSQFMLPSVKTSNSRRGFDIEDISGISMTSSFTGDYAEKEWTFTKSGSDWIVGSGGKYMKFTNTNDYKITATLEDTGDTLTIGGSANAYTIYKAGSTICLNYNSRGLINGYEGNPASFCFYRYTDGSDAEEEEEDDGCSHPRSHIIDAVSPTDTEPGYTGDLVCTNCGKVLAAGGVLAPLGGPVVKVLGATLRLKEGEAAGTQSMRVGIKVENADKALDCGIQITVGSKSFVVATKPVGEGVDVEQNTLHSKDIDEKSVVYAVIITNIPKASFATNISIRGMAWSKDGAMWTSAVSKKTVTGVVETMASKFPGLNITLGDDGAIYKNSGGALLTAADLNGYNNGPDSNN